MTGTITIAPVGNDAPADVRLDGKTDMAVLAKYWTVAGANVHMLSGKVNLNGGSSGDPSGGGYLRPGKGATITGEPGTVLEARSSIVRITIDKPGVTLKQLVFEGRAHLQWFDTGGDFVGEDLTVDQDDQFGNYDDWKAFAESQPSYAKPNTYYDLKRNCTAAFLFYAKPGKTLKKVTLRRCWAVRSYHHGFSCHTYGAQEGGTFADFLWEDCEAISCGSGLLSPRDWSCGFLVDTGNIIRMTWRRLLAVDTYQSGGHTDGSWTGHRQDVEDFVIEDFVAIDCGRRCSPAEVERFCCGIYVQSAQLINCRTERCALAGIGIKNEKPNSLVVRGCRDTGSKYGMIAEYACNGAKIQFTSDGAKVRAFQGQVTGSGTLDLTVINPPPEPAILFGRTARIDYFDCPGHAAQVRDKYDVLKYTLIGGNIIISGEDVPTYEVWGDSVLKGLPSYAPLDDEPENPPVDIPNPIPSGSLYVEDGEWIWFQPPEGRPEQFRINGTAQTIPPAYLQAGGVTLRAVYGQVRVSATGLPELALGFLPDLVRQFYGDVKGVV